MLTFITGQPGAGKTLFAVSEIDKKAAAEGRPVYYNKKKDADDPESPGQLVVYNDKLKAEWYPLDDYSGFDWHKSPEGAIILLDEAHRELFPMRKIGGDVPEHVDAMSTHRHRGHDVYITSQHSTQVDTFIRKMAGEHHHFKRTFGSSRSTQWIWLEHANERDQWDRKKAQTKSFKYPKDYFGTYKSTVLNTVKPKLPWVRIAVLVGGLVVVPIMIFVGVASVMPGDDLISETPGAESHNNVMGPVQNSSLLNSQAETRIIDRPVLYESETWSPEVSDLPFSARLYDNIVDVASFPKVTGCMRTTLTTGFDKCECHTQQGTVAQVSYRFCVDYLDRGWFDFSTPDSALENEYGLSAKNKSAPSSGVAASPASGAPGAAAGVHSE